MNTLKRRIHRRMILHKVKSLKKYTRLLMKNSEEIELLYQDLLINVTGFFRDKSPYTYLKTTLFPALLKSKKPGESFRVWVPACSTGEEAYSIGMLLLDLMGNKYKNMVVQTFATDLSEKVIARARIGEYSAKEVESIPANYLNRFFTKTDNTYTIGKSLRDICVFAPHNILHDPPFSRVDFISCRNLLIYLDHEAQKKTISTFHYALNE